MNRNYNLPCSVLNPLTRIFDLLTAIRCRLEQGDTGVYVIFCILSGQEGHVAPTDETSSEGNVIPQDVIVKI